MVSTTGRPVDFALSGTGDGDALPVALTIDDGFGNLVYARSGEPVKPLIIWNCLRFGERDMKGRGLRLLGRGWRILLDRLQAHRGRSMVSATGSSFDFV